MLARGATRDSRNPNDAMPDDILSASDLTRIAIALAVAVGAHLLVVLVRRIGNTVIESERGRSISKVRTLASLTSSVAIFALYCGAAGYALAAFHVPVSAYIASASVIGIAVAFGSQSIVQDVVTGVTILFADLFDLGDMVEIGGQSGIVRRFGMRFTVLENSFGAEVIIPNRTITSVISYPRGYVRCIADVSLVEDREKADAMEAAVRDVATATFEQYPGVLRTPPDYEGVLATAAGRRFLRVKFRIWPGRGGPIETAFKAEVLSRLKAIDSDYADWMVAINYEVEQKTGLVQRRAFRE
jgi:small-conductance mechanosensitive channel